MLCVSIKDLQLILIWFDFAFICVSAELGQFSTGKQTITVRFTVEKIFFHICFLLAFFPFISPASRGFALLVSRFKTGALNDEYIENTLWVIQSTLKSLEMHSKQRCKICVCSVILEGLGPFRSYKGLSIIFPKTCTGNNMICSDIWHKYHEWYFKIVIRWDNFEISQVVFMPNISGERGFFPSKLRHAGIIPIFMVMKLTPVIIGLFLFFQSSIESLKRLCMIV